MDDHIVGCREAPVVVEATFLMCEEPFERRRPVTLVGRAIRLKIVDTNSEDIDEAGRWPRPCSKRRGNVTPQR